jgi:hypothetical protein
MCTKLIGASGAVVTPAQTLPPYLHARAKELKQPKLNKMKSFGKISRFSTPIATSKNTLPASLTRMSLPLSPRAFCLTRPRIILSYLVLLGCGKTILVQMPKPTLPGG